MWVVKTKRQTLKQQFSSLLSHTELDIFPSPRLLFSLAIAAGYAQSKSTQRKQTVQKTVSRSYFSLPFFSSSPVCVLQKLQGISAPPWSTFLSQDSLCCFALLSPHIPLFLPGIFCLFWNVFSQRCHHLCTGTGQPQASSQKTTLLSLLLPNLGTDTQHKKCS